jgi:8-demethyl-8-alpha-L-rhamnosyltetracenomycin-C 2'-O-methyltransferase
MLDMEFETELCKSFYQYKSDKCPQLQHSYSPKYFEMFLPLKDSAQCIVEIGIGTLGAMDHLVGGNYTIGASLRAFRDFFPNAKVFGMDIREDALFKDERIECLLTDQGQVDELHRSIQLIYKNMGISKAKMPKNPILNIVIDDGSHLPAHMIVSAITFWPFVAIGGWYVIEDIDRGKYKEIFDYLSLGNAERIYFEGKDGWDFLAFKKLA